MFAQHIDHSNENRSAWAERLGISRSYLSDLLNRKKTPSLELAVRIQNLTGGAVPASSWIDAMPAAEAGAAKADPAQPTADAA
jgi:transcriptional regulator with XRE-family HTH domain